MPEIKTRDVVKGTVKTLDKSVIAAQRMKDAYIRTKEKTEHGVYSAESSPDEYAADRLSGDTETAVRETTYQFDKQGRRGFDATKDNISKAKEHFKRKRTTDPLKKQAEKRTAQQTGDGAIVAVALSQIGNVGGEPYWSWYAFSSRVEWCACFVSWCGAQCGDIGAGVIPKFAGCAGGVQWFRDRGLWQDGNFEPRHGGIIFYDWDNKGSSGPQDGQSNHVGIAEKVEGGTICTVKGDFGNSYRENYYDVGYYEILGYGTPAYEKASCKRGWYIFKIK